MKDEEKRGRKEGEKKKRIVGQPCFDPMGKEDEEVEEEKDIVLVEK